MAQFLPGAQAAYAVLDPPYSLHNIEMNGPGSVPTPPGVAENPDAEIVIGGIICPFSRETIEKLPKLRIIGTCRGGLENVDRAACEERGIMIVNGFGRNAEAVSDYAIGLMLSEIRNIARSYAELTSGSELWRMNWPNAEHIPHMKEATIGLFGFGYIGKLVAQKLSGFGSRVLVYDPFVDAQTVKKYGCEKVEKDVLFKQSDIVSVHARFTEETRGVIGKAEIDAMKPSAFFINTARAGLVDYDALLAALQEHRIAGAGLDVFPEEPIPMDSPWRHLDNCTIAGHMAGGVLAARVYAAKVVLGSIASALRGEDVPQIISKQLLKDPDFCAWAQKAAQELGVK